MPNWIENIFRQRTSVSNVIAFLLTSSYCFIVGYDVIVNANKTAIDSFEEIVMIVVSNVLIIKGVQTNTNQSK